MFQQSGSLYSGIGQAGQPASNSPIIAAAGGPNAFQAGPKGVMIARFAWRDASNSLILNNAGSGKPVGFIMNNAQATIGYLQSSSLTLSAGCPVSPVVGGFWALATTRALLGQKVFASLSTGGLSTANAGTTVPDTV